MIRFPADYTADAAVCATPGPAADCPCATDCRVSARRNSLGKQSVAWIVVLVTLFSALWGTATSYVRADEPAAAAEPPAGDLDSQIDLLIQQLGAPQYATRRKAKAELERLRLDAFDALNEAQLNDDIEIALSARYLVRSMQVSWWTEDDPLEVKHLLQDYGNQMEGVRRSLMEQLATLSSDKSLRPLCRLVRYEASDLLSKRAALLILSLEAPAGEDERAQWARLITARVGRSKRTAASWLRTYADLLANDPSALDRWQELIKTEEEQLALNPSTSSNELTRDLLKWYADQLTLRDRQDEAMVAMRKTIGLLNTTREEVLDAVDWFRERNGWSIILEIAERFPDTIKRNPMLQYRLAEAHLKLGDQTTATSVAQQALQAIPKELDKHMEVAFNLQHDGLFEWAELEYRHVAAGIDDDPAEAMRARIFLSELLHELERDREAGETLTDLLKLLKEQEAFRTLLETDLMREVEGLTSRMHFFYAQQFGKDQQYPRQREELLKGINSDPFDADILIAMFRAPEADAAWKEEASRRIREAVEHFRQEIHDLNDQFNGEHSAEERALAAWQLALTNNQLAWLVSNTEGDFNEALRCSQRSLELQPSRSGFLDTLGRCYYAKGEFENAIKYQLQAVAKEPHSPAIQAQLRLFQQALEQSQHD